MNQNLHQAMWQRQEIGRPLLGINAGFMASQRFPLLMKHVAGKAVRPEDIRADLFLKDCDRLYETHQNLGDYPYVAAPFAGMAWLEAIMGCPIQASDTNLWAEPCISQWDQWHWQKPDRQNPWYQKLIELMQALVEHSRGRYQVAPTLMRGPSDILFALRGASNLLMDLIDEPEVVKKAAALCAEFWVEAAQAQLECIPHSEAGYIAGDAALRSWAPDKLAWLQEDAMALLSPKIFREFFLPLDRQIARQIPCVAFHLHGSALWAIDDLLGIPEIDVMELNLDDANCDVEGTLNGWKKIQARKPLVIWRMYGDDFPVWLERILRELPANGVSIHVSTRDLEEARKVNEIFQSKVNQTQSKSIV
ncbi:MAG: Uroporphyrinogen decarboxylase (URO-D) [Planctomycetes bacterium ADurb.Bin412]|nr:MAG: Uroporphyrinogen decarboxylase (URO-D) [Planctomycetes bacterium ADurb.Bin412]